MTRMMPWEDFSSRVCPRDGRPRQERGDWEEVLAELGARRRPTAPLLSPEALPGARPCEHLVPLLYGLTPEEGVALRADEDASGL